MDVDGVGICMVVYTNVKIQKKQKLPIQLKYAYRMSRDRTASIYNKIIKLECTEGNVLQEGKNKIK